MFKQAMAELESARDTYDEFLSMKTEKVITEMLAKIAERSPKHDIEFTSGMGTRFVLVNGEIVDNYNATHGHEVCRRYEKHFDSFHRSVHEIESKFWNDTGIAINDIKFERTQ